MTVINTNVAAQITANAMKTNSKTMETTMERLATGFRINSAGDDAAGLGIGSKMTSQIRGLDQAVRNANDAISMLQTADGASVEISNMLQRMRELSVQARNGTNSSDDLVNLNKEFAQLANEIERVADDTSFNGQKIMNGDLSTVTFNVGAGVSDTMTFTFRDFELDQGSTAGTAGVQNLAITTATYSGYGATDEMHITNSAGDTVIIDADAIDAATGAGTNFSDVGYTQLVLAINNQIDAADDAAGFEGMEAADVGGAGTSISFTQDTAGSGDVLSIKRVTSAGVMTDFGTLTTTTVGSASGGDGNPMGANLDAFKTAGSQAQAYVDASDNTLAKLDAAITGVDRARADFGAVINRLEYTVDNLNSIAQNTRSARSAVMDADYAAETTELARTQIISQAATAMLSQANQQAQSVLALLK